MASEQAAPQESTTAVLREIAQEFYDEFKTTLDADRLYELERYLRALASVWTHENLRLNACGLASNSTNATSSSTVTTSGGGDCGQRPSANGVSPHPEWSATGLSCLSRSCRFDPNISAVNTPQSRG